MKIRMLDGTTYIPDRSTAKAIKIRLKEDENWLHDFRQAVKKYWDNKLLPNKFGDFDDWTKEYKNQSEFAKDAIYPFVRAILMGMAFNELTKGKGKVVALEEDGNTKEYPNTGDSK